MPPYVNCMASITYSHHPTHHCMLFRHVEVVSQHHHDTHVTSPYPSLGSGIPHTPEDTPVGGCHQAQYPTSSYLPISPPPHSSPETSGHSVTRILVHGRHTATGTHNTRQHVIACSVHMSHHQYYLDYRHPCNH